MEGYRSRKVYLDAICENQQDVTSPDKISISRPRDVGFAYIFIHTKFESFSEPNIESDEKCDLLKEALKKEGYVPVIKVNYSLSMMKEFLEEEAGTDFSRCERMLVFILTIEIDDYLYTLDDKYLINEVYDNFVESKCPSLRGKQKFFFVQVVQMKEHIGANHNNLVYDTISIQFDLHVVKYTTKCCPERMYMKAEVNFIRMFVEKLDEQMHAICGMSTNIIKEANPVQKIPYYTMNFNHLGLALIFNHETFYDGHETRTGTNKDKNILMDTLKSLKFEVEIHNDLTANEIKTQLKRVAAMDHTNNSCLIVIVMTHGNENKLYAKDRCYDYDELWESMLPTECPTLVGKPKLFFVQACRGESSDGGVRIDSHDLKFKTIPNFADFFVGYSTYFGYKSMRNVGDGSWFIQELALALNHHKSQDICAIMTEVNRNVANKYSNDIHGKQMPNFLSTLTKLLVFDDGSKNKKKKRKNLTM